MAETLFLDLCQLVLVNETRLTDGDSLLLHASIHTALSLAEFPSIIPAAAAAATLTKEETVTANPDWKIQTAITFEQMKREQEGPKTVDRVWSQRTWLLRKASPEDAVVHCKAWSQSPGRGLSV